MNPTVGRLGRWSLGTYFTLLVLFLYTPLIVIFVFSFNNSTIPALPLSGFTTRWYHAAFNDSELLDAVVLSAKIAIFNSIFATCLAGATLSAGSIHLLLPRPGRRRDLRRRGKGDLLAGSLELATTVAWPALTWCLLSAPLYAPLPALVA